MDNIDMFTANKDSFAMKDDVLQMPIGGSQIPIERQKAVVNQFSLGFPEQRRALAELFNKAFKKEIVVWFMERGWSKEGDLVVAVFYSEITKPKNINTGSNKIIVSKDEIAEFNKSPDDMFDEAIKAIKDMALSPEEEK